MTICRRSRMDACIALAVCGVLTAGAGDASTDRERRAATDRAAHILSAAGVRAGLVVHVNCGEGSLTAALRAGDRIRVHGIDTDADRARKAREHVSSLGLYGPVTVGVWNGSALPHADNLVNLIVVENAPSLETREMMRVLRPLGTACVRRNGRWAFLRKPWPPDIDEWTHFLHDPSNNAVARDTVVGPPRRMQWVADPAYSRAHTTFPSVTCVVTSAGRLFAIVDHGPIELPFLPGRYHLVARDAFNGMLLWERPFPDWEPVSHRLKAGPPQIQRRLVAVKDRVYVTPGIAAPVTAFDAETGKEVRTYAGTERTQEILLCDGVLYLVVGDRAKDRALSRPPYMRLPDFGVDLGPRTPLKDEPDCRIVAIEAATGRTLWEKPAAETRGYQATTLVVCGRRAAFQTESAIVCLDRLTGTILWRTAHKANLSGKRSSGAAPTVVMTDRAVYAADGRSLTAYATENGSMKWQRPSCLQYHQPPDLFVAAGAVWSNASLDGYDPESGEVIGRRGEVPDEPMGHDRCYRNKATERYIINSRAGGADFSCLGGERSHPNPWVRGICNFGILPANGLLYAPPHACSCCNEVMLNGFWALAAGADPEKPADRAGERTPPIEKGPAFSRAPAPAGLRPAKLAARRGAPGGASGPAFSSTAGAESEPPEPGAWPTYRHDAARSAATDVRLPVKIECLWTRKIGRSITAPTMAAGKVFVAATPRYARGSQEPRPAAGEVAHTVYALDATTGDIRWRFAAGGSVDSPPTYHRGRVLFGSRDGWVYSLDAATGALAWRLRAAPEERLVCARGRLESAWPVHGSVLVTGDVAYFAAGRSVFLDGGIRLYGVRPGSGEVLYRRTLSGPYDENGDPVLDGKRSIRGGKADILASDGRFVYLRHLAFRTDLTPVDVSSPERSTGRTQVARPHVIPSAGFLDPWLNHRQYWTYGSMLCYDEVLRQRQGIDADILAVVRSSSTGRGPGVVRSSNTGRGPGVGADTVYGVRGIAAGRQVDFDPRLKGYRLFAGEAVRQTDDQAGARRARKRRRSKLRTEIVTYRLKPKWSADIPVAGKAVVHAGGTVVVAGTPNVFPPDDVAGAVEGRMGGVIWLASASDGRQLASVTLPSPPVADGLIVADGRAFVSLGNGAVSCYGEK